MRKFKKALAFALASAMIVSVVPVSAATSNTAKAGKKVIYTYTVNKGATADNKQTWIKTTKKSGYTVKYFNQTSSIVSLNKKSGKVVAKKAGTAKIKVNFYNKSGKYVGNKVVKITVKKAPVAKGIAIEKATLNVGETTKVTTSNGAKVYCYSADTSIVKVNKTTGEVTAVAPGTTKIAVRNAITKKRVYVDVTVNAEFGAKQTGAKTITVTGANFTKESKIEITKGSQTVTFDAKNVTIASDGKAMEIVTNSNIMDAEYKVKVDDKEATFKGEASKITTIEIPGDVAVASQDTTLPYVDTKVSGSAIVAYAVKNQFGEDLTKTTQVTVSASRTSSVDANKGEIKLNLVQNDKEGDLISVVIINQETGVSTSKTVKLSAKSAINSLEVKGLYNKDGKTLSEDNSNKDTFYLLVSAKDQYGKNITEAELDKDVLVSVGAGLTNLGEAIPTTGKTETVTVDGVDYMALPLKKVQLKAGVGTVLLISKTTGKNTQATVTVADGIKVATFSASPANTVVAGKDNVFTFSATDTYGKEIAEPTAEMFAEDTAKSVFGTTDGKFRFEKNATTGKTELIYKAEKSNKDTVKFASFITKTGQVATVQFTVKANAQPTTITGVKSTVGTISGRAITIKASDIKLEDQYGQAYTDTLGTEYSYELTGTGKVFKKEKTEEGWKLASKETGDEKFTLALKVTENGTTKTVSEYTFTAGARSMSDLTSFKAESALVYNKATETTDVKVTGVASDGTEIELEKGTDYTLVGTAVESNAISGGAISFTAGKVETKETSVKIIINNDKGSEVDLTVKVSNEAPKAATVESVTDYTITAFTAEEVMKAIKVKDQYGENYITETARVTFSAYGDGVTVDKNNTSSAKLTGDVKFATVKYTFNSGVTYTRNVVLN